MLYSAVQVICKASKDWLCLTGSFDFIASGGIAAILGLIKESAVAHVNKFKKVSHVYSVVGFFFGGGGKESFDKKTGQTVQCDMQS